MEALGWVVLVESLVIAGGIGALVWARGHYIVMSKFPETATAMLARLRDSPFVSDADRLRIERQMAELAARHAKPANPPDRPDDEANVLAQIEADPRYAGRPPEARRAAARIIADRVRENFGRAVTPRREPPAA